MRAPILIASKAALAALVIGLALPLPAAAEEEVDGEALVDALNGIFGKHKVRSSHAKGICVTGSFTPSDDAAGLSKAPHFTKPVPVLGRFSIGGGNPKASDAARGVRGLALRFDLGDDGNADLVMLTAPIFFARTPAQALGFLKVRAPVADGKPDAAAVKAFSEANPETTRQAEWVAKQPIPASYASTAYFGIHAFTFTNAEGKATTVKIKVVPAAGEAGLTDEEAKAKPADFYAEELDARLANGPAAFDIVAIIGEAGDPVDDSTVLWPDERKTISLGSVAIAATEADATCDETIFDPANLPDGIEGPANDGIFNIRSAAYASSFARRAD